MHFIHNVQPAFGQTRQFTASSGAKPGTADLKALEAEVGRLEARMADLTESSIAEKIAEALTPLEVEVAKFAKRRHVEAGGLMNSSEINPFSGRVEPAVAGDWSDYDLNSFATTELANSDDAKRELAAREDEWQGYDLNAGMEGDTDE